MKIQQRGFLNKYFMLTIFYLFSFITFLSFPLIHKTNNITWLPVPCEVLPAAAESSASSVLFLHLFPA